MPSGNFAINIDGPSGSIDALLQELILNRGLYYYVCAITGSPKRDVISKGVVPIYVTLIEGRFENPCSHLVRRNLTGKLEEGSMPGDLVEEFSHDYEVLFRRWHLGIVSDFQGPRFEERTAGGQLPIDWRLGGTPGCREALNRSKRGRSSGSSR